MKQTNKFFLGSYTLPLIWRKFTLIFEAIIVPISTCNLSGMMRCTFQQILNQKFWRSTNFRKINFFSVFLYFHCYYMLRYQQKSTYNLIRVITKGSNYKICFHTTSSSTRNNKLRICDISFDFEPLPQTAPSAETYQKTHSGIRASQCIFWYLQTSVPPSFHQTTSSVRSNSRHMMQTQKSHIYIP